MIAGHVFVYDDDAGRSRARAAEVDEDDAILEAAASCPVAAIEVIDATSGERIDT